MLWAKRTIAQFFADLPWRLVYFAATVVRVALILYGEWQDANSAWLARAWCAAACVRHSFTDHATVLLGLQWPSSTPILTTSCSPMQRAS